jgi:hypothetical protein
LAENSGNRKLINKSDQIMQTNNRIINTGADILSFKNPPGYVVINIVIPIKNNTNKKDPYTEKWEKFCKKLEVNAFLSGATFDPGRVKTVIKYTKPNTAIKIVNKRE